MSYPLVMIPLALTLAVALVGMLTRLIVPVVRRLWTVQVRDAEAQVTALLAIRLPRSHRRPRFGRAA